MFKLDRTDEISKKQVFPRTTDSENAKIKTFRKKYLEQHFVNVVIHFGVAPLQIPKHPEAIIIY